jgi:hypothetical protein
LQTFYATRSTAGAAFVFLISSLSGRWAIVATAKSTDERIVCLEPTFLVRRVLSIGRCAARAPKSVRDSVISSQQDVSGPYTESHVENRP